MNAIVSVLALCALCLLAFLALKFCDKRLALVFGILFAVYVAADDFVTGLGWTAFRCVANERRGDRPGAATAERQDRRDRAGAAHLARRGAGTCVQARPALLLGLARGRNPPLEIPWAVIAIAAVPYSLVHGLSYSDGTFAFDLNSALWTLSGGFVYGWLRFSTGSLLFPFMAHSFTNVAFQLAPLIAA